MSPQSREAVEVAIARLSLDRRGDIAAVQQDAQALAQLAELLEAEISQLPPKEEGSLELAGHLARLLCEALDAAWGEGEEDPCRLAVREAVAAGPEAMDIRATELMAAIALGEGRLVNAEAEGLFLECLELRLACLDHLLVVFDAQRIWP